jgi:hypothetical protein
MSLRDWAVLVLSVLSISLGLFQCAMSVLFGWP